MAANIVVIGGGVIGLSTALNIQTQVPGSKVKVIAEKLDSETTSHGSGGIWVPTLAAHPHEKEINMRKWCQGSWEFYRNLATGPEAGNCGACISNGYIITRYEYPDPLYKDYVFCYRQLKDEELTQLNFPPEFRYGYNVTTIILDQRKYLKWLMNRFIQKGGDIEKRRVVSLAEFAGRYDVVVNCTGFGSRDLVGDDDMFAIRGQVLKVKAPWVKNWVCDPENVLANQTFIIPGENLVTLGSTKHARNESLVPTPENSADLLQRCSRLVPSLRTAEMDHVWVGLRPGRHVIRLEAEQVRCGERTLKVVHNYGHSANGVALGWGTAMEAAQLVKQALHAATARL